MSTSEERHGSGSGKSPDSTKLKLKDGEAYEQLDSYHVPEVFNEEEVDDGEDIEASGASAMTQHGSVGSEQEMEATGAKKSKGGLFISQKKHRAKMTQAKADLEQANKKHAAVLRLKAKELREKDAIIKSLEANVAKLKQSEDSIIGDLKAKNLKLEEDVRHKEKLERLQQEKIHDLEGKVAMLPLQNEDKIKQLKVDIEQHEQKIEQQYTEISQHKEECKAHVDRYKKEIDHQKDEAMKQTNHHKAELDAVSGELEQARGKLAEGERAFDRLGEEGERVRGQFEEGERNRIELEKKNQELQMQNGDLLMKLKEREEKKRAEGEQKLEQKKKLESVQLQLEERRRAEGEEETKHKKEIESVQLELEVMNGELNEKSVKVCKLEDELRSAEETMKTLRADLVASRSPEQGMYAGSTVAKGSLNTRTGGRLGQEHRMKQELADSARLSLATPDIPSNVHQFCLQLSKLVDPEGQSLEVSPRTLGTEALQSLKSIGVFPNVKSRGYVVAVFQAYVRAQSILLDYSQVGKGHEVLLDPAVGDHEKSPHTSLGEEKKSPFSSLGDVKMVVAEENMTDADKWELQEMLKESHEELERLWNHNKTLVERLKAMEMQQHLQEPSVAEDSEAGSEVNECLRAYEQQLCYLPKPSKQERKAGTADALRQLKDEYLSMHTEKMSLLEKLEEQDAQLKEMRAMLAESGKEKYLSMHTEKMSLLEKLEERDAQLKEMRETLAESGITPTNYPHLECSLSLGALGSPENPKVEVYRLRSVIEEKEKKLENMNMQVKTFEDVANEKAGLEEQVEQLSTQLRTLEEVQRLKDDSELVQHLQGEDTNAAEVQKLEQEKADMEELWKREKDRLQKEVADFQNKMREKDTSIADLTERMESGMARLRDEKERYAQQNDQLHAKLKKETSCIPQNSEEDPTLEIVKRLSEVEATKESVIQENKALKDDITAWKYKVDAVEEDFRKERNERENMAAKHSDEFGKWVVLEQQLREQLEYSENKYREQVQKMNASEQLFQEELKRQKHHLHELQQREFQLTAKLDDQRAHAAKHQQEMDEQLDRLREEGGIIRAQWNDMTTRYGEEKDKNIALQKENKHLQVHFTDLQAHTKDLETHLQNLEEQYQLLQGENRSMEAQLEDDKLKNEKLHELTAAMKRDLENKLHESIQQKDHLASRLGAQEQQRKHDYALWMADRQELEGAIADTARLSDEGMALNQQLKHIRTQADSFKAKLQEEKSMSKQREEEHRAEVDVIKAQYEDAKMEQDRLMIPLKRELDQLRSQAFGDGQHSDTFRRMERELQETRNEVETWRKKYHSTMDGFVLARDLLLRNNIPLPKHEVLDEGTLQDTTPYVRIYDPSRQPPVDNIGRGSNVAEVTAGFHRLGDYGARLGAYSARTSEANVQPRMLPSADIPSAPSTYSNDRYGDQQILIPPKLPSKPGYDKPGGYPEKPVSPNLAAPEQRFQPSVLRAHPQQGGGGVIQGRAPYSQPGGGAVHGRAYDQRSQPPVSEVQHYQQPRYPPPQPRLPQGQQAMMNAPQPHHAPPGHGQPQNAPHGHSDAPQGMPYPPSSPQGRRPPNPSAPQENFLVKGIDAEIAEAAAGVRQEVTLESMVPAAEAWPLDSNLICPMCKKQYRIGQIQYYKQHVDKCEGV